MPKAHFDDKVRGLVLDRILEDGMSIERVLQWLRREFLLHLYTLDVAVAAEPRRC